MSETSGEKKCKSCEKPASRKIRQHDYCGDCFLEACLHLFRATFGKNRTVRDNERVLVAVSGGEGSLAMLLLIQQGLRPQENRKLRFSPLFFHLDEREISSSEEPAEAVTKLFTERELDHRVMKMSELLSGDVLSLLKSKAELTSRLALLDIFRTRALLKAARDLSCSRILLGDTSTRLAGRALEAVLQGRGGSVDPATAFCDARFSPSLIRPMLELSSSECAALVALSGLQAPPAPRGPLSRVSGMASLQGLTARMLRDLEPSFPATNFALLRTAGKIRAQEGAPCRLCGGVVVPPREGESAVLDLQFCHERASGAVVFAETSLCYGCSVLAQKHSQLRSWLDTEQPSFAL